MVKKYSVQMENDEPLSIEVDDVRYITPDDIPDQQDRKKIKALIHRKARADSEESLDEEFAQDLREMKRQSTVFPKLLLAIFLGVAAITLTISVFSAYSAIQTISREESTSGRVVDLVDRSSRNSETGEVTVYTYPVVEYSLPDLPLRVQMSEGSSPPDHAIGDQVTVLYDPQQPRQARIKSFSSDLLLWILPGITFLVGAAFATAAFVVFKMWPPYQRETV